MFIYNIDFEIAGIALCVALLIFMSVQKMPTVSALAFKRIIVFNILATSLDALTVVFFSFPGKFPLWLNYFINSLGFVMGVVTTAAIFDYFIIYIEKNRVNRVLKCFGKINIGVVVLFVVLFIINAKKPIIFHIDEAGVYTRVGVIYPIVYIVPALYIAASAVYIAICYKKVTRRQVFSILVFSILMITGMALQFFVFPNVFLSYFFSSLAILCMSFAMETPDYVNLMKYMEALEKAKTDAENATRARDNFLANMSHELRTPLVAVLGRNDMILRTSEENKTVQYSKDVRRAGYSLLSMIISILEFTKMESGSIEIKDEMYDVRSLLDEIGASLIESTGKKRIKGSVYVDKKIPSNLSGDRDRVKQAIMNLVDNAVKYTDEGEVNVDISFDYVKKSDEDILIKVVVEDTGIGIREDDLDELFKSFKRLDDEKNINIKGAGLGLAMAKQISKMMGGDVTVESKYLVGSKFTLTLVQRKASDEELGEWEISSKLIEEDEDRKKTELSIPDARILVVDDNELNLDVLSGLIELSEAKVDVAVSGFVCVDLCNKNRYDMIFMDQMMPEIDGAETLALLRKRGLIDSTIVVALTADAVSGAREKYLSYGFDEYMSKPVDYGRIEKMLKKYLSES